MVCVSLLLRLLLVSAEAVARALSIRFHNDASLVSMGTALCPVASGSSLRDMERGEKRRGENGEEWGGGQLEIGGARGL